MIIDATKVVEMLERCIDGSDCDSCDYVDNCACKEYLLQDAIDLINHQKAEIERLSNFVSEERCYEIAREMIPHFVKQARNEAIKEFAKKLMELYTDEHITDDMHCSVGVIKQNIYDVKKIMVGENK